MELKEIIQRQEAMIEELKSKLDAQAASKKNWLSRVIKLHLLKANQQEEETIQEA